MRVLVTGSEGFVGKNLCTSLRTQSDVTVYAYDKDSEPDALPRLTADCDFVFHLAGVNRPDDTSQFAQNFSITSYLTDCLKQNNNLAPIVFASSVQAQCDNPYGQSKREAERLLLEYGQQCGTKVLVYRLSNVFGKWCRPQYNSVVATFCDAAANGRVLPVNDPAATVRLVYIDDVVAEFLRVLHRHGEMPSDIYAVQPSTPVTVGWLACRIAGFAAERTTLCTPDVGDPLIKKLYSTYLTYLPAQKLSYPLTEHADDRGAFYEFMRLKKSGQISVNRIAPHASKGGHYHHTKAEKFLTVSGVGEVRLTPLHGGEPIVVPVDGHNCAVVDIPPGYVHWIVNTGETELVTVIWANEWFCCDRTDTYLPD